MKAARVSPAEVNHAKAVAESAGLRLVGYEKHPDGTVKLEFGEIEAQDNARWIDGSPLYRSVA